MADQLQNRKSVIQAFAISAMASSIILLNWVAAFGPFFFAAALVLFLAAATTFVLADRIVKEFNGSEDKSAMKTTSTARLTIALLLAVGPIALVILPAVVVVVLVPTAINLF